MEEKKLEVSIDFGVKRHIVGSLVFFEKQQQYGFSYDNHFASLGLELSPLVLPIKEGIHFSGNQRVQDDPFYGLHSVFADSLPDRWGRQVQDEHFQKHGMDAPGPLERLAFIGEDGMGALRYKPTISFGDKAEKIVTATELRKEALKIYRGDVREVSAGLLKAGGTAGGMRPKYLVNYYPDTQQISYGVRDERGGAVAALIKVPLKKGEEYQKIEYVYSQMVRGCGIDIPRTWLHAYESGESYFLIERFDRTLKGEILHLHSAAGLLGKRFDQIVGDYNELFALTAKITRDKTCLQQLYKRMVFNVLAHNCDDHYKNISYVMNHEGTWRLSPAYDMTYSMGREGLHASRINGKVRDITEADFEKVAKRVGVSAWRACIDEVLESLSQWPRLARQVGMSGVRVEKLEKLMEANRRSLI